MRHRSAALVRRYARAAVRIAYLMPWSLDPDAGVMKKVRAQVAVWAEHGHEVRRFVLSAAGSPMAAASRASVGSPGSAGQAGSAGQPGSAEEPGSAAQAEPTGGGREHGVEVFEFASALDALGATRRLVDAARAWSPDVVYARYAPWYPALRRVARAVPTVLEVNTEDRREYRLTGRPVRGLVNELTRRRTLGLAAGLVFVTHQLRDHPSFSWFGGATEVVPNGFDLASVDPLPPSPEATPTVVFLGSPGLPWHGTDRLLELARALPEVRFEVVGSTAEQLAGATPSPGRARGRGRRRDRQRDRQRDQQRDRQGDQQGDRPRDRRLGGLPDNVVAHGYLERGDYAAVLARAYAAVGSLALDRLGMTEGSTLKLREYLAHGLPVVTGCPDADFPGGAPFLLEIDAARLEHGGARRAGEADAVRRFVEAHRGERVPREALAHLDTGAKEARRLAFLSRVAGTR